MFGCGLFAGLPVEVAAGDVYLGAHSITLVEDRANEVSVPLVLVQGVNTKNMEWDSSQHTWVPAAGATRISEFIKQVNQRILGSTTLNNTVVKRAETVDGDTGNRFVFTPGATPPGSLQDFEVIIQDQDGDYESRGFLIFLQTTANPYPAIDGGLVVIRLTPKDLPW
jgi:hypothetical protein